MNMIKSSPMACFVFTLLVLIVYIGFITILLPLEYDEMLVTIFVFASVVVVLLIAALVTSSINVSSYHHFLSYISLIISILMVASLPIILILKTVI